MVLFTYKYNQWLFYYIPLGARRTCISQRHDSFTNFNYNKRIVPLPCLQWYWIFFYPQILFQKWELPQTSLLTQSVSMTEIEESHCASCVQGAGISVRSWQPSWREGASHPEIKDWAPVTSLPLRTQLSFHLSWQWQGRPGELRTSLKNFLHTC